MISTIKLVDFPCQVVDDFLDKISAVCLICKLFSAISVSRHPLPYILQEVEHISSFLPWLHVHTVRTVYHTATSQLKPGLEESGWYQISVVYPISVRLWESPRRRHRRLFSFILDIATCSISVFLHTLHQPDMIAARVILFYMKKPRTGFYSLTLMEEIFKD